MADAADVVADPDAVNANVFAARIDAAQETIAAAGVATVGATVFGLMKTRVATAAVVAVAVRIRKAAVVEVKDILLDSLSPHTVPYLILHRRCRVFLD